MNRSLLLILFCFGTMMSFAQSYSISGMVAIENSKTPVDMAVVMLPELNLWSVANNKGEFKINNIKSGEYEVNITCMGYLPLVFKLNINKNWEDITFYMKEDNLSIKEVVITAKENPNSMSTSRTISKTALDHLQVVNVSDISSLLPGGKTVNPDLMRDNVFSIRGGGSAQGNASFGTAVEVDGVRLSTNASFGDMSGASTRNVASSNIESIEVVSGIPSVEYGDMTSGMVRVKTRKGKTPYTATFSTNPQTKQFSLGKGFDLGGNAGIINANAERTIATDNPTSPYKRYQRNVLTLNYSNTFNQNHNPIQFSAGATGNIGGMNTKDDPDAFTGEFRKDRDNAVRFNMSASMLFNKPWITNLEFSSYVNYSDQKSEYHRPIHNASQLPSVNTPLDGYYLANQLPKDYENTEFADSRPLDYNATLKATLARRYGNVNNKIKLGLVWNSNGNIGKGDYFADEALQKNGYRPRPYTDIPFMHTFAAYLEDNVTVPIGSTSLSIVAGVRAEKTIIKNSKYNKANSFSPRFNGKYLLVSRGVTHTLRSLSIRGGWGITEKLPSFNVLYPLQKYRDIQVFGASYGDSQSIYAYHTTPYVMQYNDNLRWTRNRNIEIGIDADIAGVKLSLTAYSNRTKYPYQLSKSYTPFSYRMSEAPNGFIFPNNPDIKVDSNTGHIYVGDKNNPFGGSTLMNTKVIDQTFAESTVQTNGSPVDRKGIELVVDFGQIKSIRTSFRLDASYSYVKYSNESLEYSYKANMSHSSLKNRSFEYVGIYVGSPTQMNNGKRSENINANLTITTHIPSVRMVISLRVEGALMTHSRNISSYNGRELAYMIDDPTAKNPTGGSIYDASGYSAVRPAYYMDLNGNIFNYDDRAANDPVLKGLILSSNTTYTFDKDGYDPYFAANLSVTKEIGDLASISFYANNFTNAKNHMYSYAAKNNVVMTPEFYYGLTLRLKF